MVVELERGRLISQNYELLKKENSELIIQNGLLKDQVKLVNDKYIAADALVKSNEILYKQKEDILNKELSDAKKPRWTAMFASAGVGSLLTLIAIILLH